MTELEFQNWGLIDYQEALQKQEALVEQIHQKQAPGVLIFCTHPPVVTLGRKSQPEDLFDWQGPTLEVSRGGRATYHGPSQLVVYPVLNLDQPHAKFQKRDIGGYLRTFEEAVVRVLQSYGVQAQGKSLQKKSSETQEQEETGVWVQARKIASLGIGVRKWVAFHGAAINLDRDPRAFRGMRPCGFSASTMVSLEETLGAPVDRPQFESRLREELLLCLQLNKSATEAPFSALRSTEV